MNEIKFTIPGDVQAQQRPRFSRHGNGVRTYDAKPSRDYKRYVSEIARQFAAEELIDSAIELHIDIYRAVQKSISKKERERRLTHVVRPTVKPDVENYAKGIMDGLTGVLWVDDSLVVTLSARKFYGSEPRAEVTVRW